MPLWFRMRSFSTILLTLCLAGCAHFGGGYEEPEVFLVGLRPLAVDSLEQRFEVELRILNPNETDLEIDGIDVTVELNGARLTRGVSGAPLTIPRLSDDTITLLATTTVFDLVNQIIRSPAAQTFEYELRGKVFLANSPARLSFSKVGQLIPESVGEGR